MKNYDKQKKCLQFYKYYEENIELVDNGLISDEMNQHVENCEDCLKFYKEMSLIKSAVLSTTEIDLPKTFKSELSNKLKAVETKPLYGSFVFKPAMALVILLICLGFYYWPANNVPNELIKISTDKYLYVELRVNTFKNIDNINFLVNLPKGIRFVSNKDKIKSKTLLNWKSGLKKGINKFPFVLAGVEPGDYKVDFVLSDGIDKKSSKINLQISETDNVKMSYFKIDYKPAG